MGSYATKLTVVNNTPIAITGVTATVQSEGDWDGVDRPDRNFKGPIPAWSALTKREELNSGPSTASFRMNLTFANGDVVTFGSDQYAAHTRAGRPATRRDLEVGGTSAIRYRALEAAGDDSNTICVSRATLTSAWMTQLPGDLPLTALTLPGTHDTGTWPNYGGESANCQTMDLMTQLRAGIRFIDIRCVHVNNAFAIHHSNAFQHLWFAADIRDVCLEFLKENPGETIVLSIKHERGLDDKDLDYGNTRTFEETVRAELPPSLCYLGQRVPTLGQVRGKLVLLRRYGGSSGLASTQGIDASTWWPHDDVGHHTNSSGVTLQVQDAYSMALGSSDKKWTLVHTHLTGAVAGLATDWWINFSSASGGAFPDFFAKGTRSAGDGINAWMFDFLTGQTAKRFGTVVMDFPEYPGNKILLDQLVSLNRFLRLSGNPVRAFNHVDTYSGVHTFEQVRPIDADGAIRTWMFFAGPIAPNTRHVQLVIYRKNASGGFDVVATSAAETASPGYNAFDLNPKISVRKGDFIGFFQPDGGVINFFLDGPYGRGDLTGRAVFTAPGGPATAFVDSSQRVYAIAVGIEE